MFKKSFIVIFVIFAYLAYGVAFSYSRAIDSDRILAWYDQPEFQVSMLDLPADLGGAKSEVIVEKLISLSEMLSVNVFVQPHSQPSSENFGQDLYLYAYLQDDEYLHRLPATLQINSGEEFNNAVHQEITNGKSESKIGLLDTTSHHINFHLSSLLSIPNDDYPTTIFLTHRDGQALSQFVNEIALHFPSISISVTDSQEFSTTFRAPLTNGVTTLLFNFSQHMGTNLLIATVFLLLTTILLLFNNRRGILIKKLHGQTNLGIYAKQIYSLVLPSFVISILLAIPFHFIYQGLFNTRMLATFSIYVFGLILLLLLFFIFSFATMFYIIKLKPVDLIKYKQSSNTVLISISYLAKAATIPLLIISLTISINNLTDTATTKSRLDNYKSAYKDYVRLIGGTPAEYVTAEDGGNYISRVYNALETEKIALFISRLHMDGFPMEIPVKQANINFVERYAIKDNNNVTVDLNSNQKYILVPQGQHNALFEVLRQNPVWITSFLDSVPNSFNPFTASEDEIENLAQQAVTENVIIIKDNQSIPHFNIDGLNTFDGMLDEYILFIGPEHRPFNLNQIFIGIQEMNNFEDEISSTLAKHDLPMTFDLERATLLLDQVVRSNQHVLFSSFRESLVHILLLAYISYLTIFFYYQSRKQEIAINILHGKSIFSQFNTILIFNLALDSAIYFYIIHRGSYMGHTLVRGTNIAFITLLILDVIILFASILSFRSQALQGLLKQK